MAGVVIQRGPFTYALPIDEDWQEFDPPATAMGLKRGLQSYRIYPKKNSIWNYAIRMDRNNPKEYIKIKQLSVPKGSKPWEHSPIGLEVKAKQVLNWRMDGEPDHPMTPGMPYSPMKLSEQETTITLIPVGFTHLRLTYLPYY